MDRAIGFILQPPARGKIKLWLNDNDPRETKRANGPIRGQSKKEKKGLGAGQDGPKDQSGGSSGCRFSIEPGA